MKLLRALRVQYLRALIRLTPKHKRYFRYGVPAGFRYDFPDQTVLEEHGWICGIETGISTFSGENLDREGYLYTECSFDSPEQRLEEHEFSIMRIGWDKLNPQISVQQGLVVSLTMNLAYLENYFHWLFDVLPRLSLVRATVTVPFNVYTHSGLQFQRDSLTALGISAEKIIPAQTEKIVRADKLLVPSIVNAFRGVPLWVVEFLRSELMPTLIDQNALPVKRVFISRDDASHRRATNENILVEYLSRYGFEKVLASELSLKQQVNLFVNADIVVGIHGAALANLVFCSPGTKVLEIMPPNFDWSLFGELAGSCSLEYRKVLANNQVDTETNKFLYQKKDFEINMKLIQSELRCIIE